MIYEGSRYETAPTLATSDKLGYPATAVYPPNRRGVDFVFFDYLTVVGDRFDILAQRFYNDAEQWWRVAEANPSFFYPEEVLPVGTLLRIPNAA